MIKFPFSLYCSFLNEFLLQEVHYSKYLTLLNQTYCIVNVGPSGPLSFKIELIYFSFVALQSCVHSSLEHIPRRPILSCLLPQARISVESSASVVSNWAFNTCMDLIHSLSRFFLDSLPFLPPFLPSSSCYCFQK